MKNKIFRALVALAAMAVLVASGLITFLVSQDYFNETKKELAQEARYISMGLESGGNDFLNKIAAENGSNVRITLIDKDGIVLFDNQAEAKTLENHAMRQEIMEAVAVGAGEAERFSDTLDKTTYYYAVRLEDGKILRLARTIDSIYKSVLQMLPIMGGIVIVVAFLASIVARRVTFNLIKPLDQVNLDEPLDNETYDELAPFLTRIAKQKRQLSKNLKKLRGKQEELTIITNNMNEGLVLLNGQQNVLFINESAAKIFGFSAKEVIGRNILTVDRAQEVQDLLQKVSQAGKGEGLYEKDGHFYQLSGSSVNGSGSVILIYDVTEKMTAEKLRREFSANVSHELKTPLQSILGYAEIMKNGLVKDEDKQRFLERIHAEAGNMIELIQNIMELSRLDENKTLDEFEDVDLLKLAQSVTLRLKHKAQTKGVTLNVSGSSACVCGVQSILSEVLYNLVDNSIKYNKDNGKVDVKVQDGSEEVTVSVSDTGIGIGAADRERVFERFYRADKSHSKEIGGTGLGLSIVKHGVLFHKGRVELESEPGVGTTITFVLPKKRQ
ncbi:ATP-binding protein [Phascolarctobacterium sp. ET69]|uniref:sensor histidine kinase n=1 Tax=Phascolarctobacterium sp. ET69 TaxID=2939420 RepID=UPI002011537A|nr:MULTISPECIES: ATP-binding protein [Phascolarctobacterium]MCL1604436.1 ATP-binding protein [Phascolarctobacterium sp. ET69]MDM8111137.1 ATP-binding protein [Phascolarctobacterium faecium]